MRTRNLFIKAALVFTLALNAVPTAAETNIEPTKVYLTTDMTYAANSKIHSDPALLYLKNDNGITVCVNAGHGTVGGESERTLCHPDGSAKITGGTTSAGATTASAISSGMTFSDGTPEAQVTLAEAVILRDMLLEKGYNVLMIRENNDTKLDNVARTVLANNYADCHIAIHWDSTTSDKGAFYCKVPDNATYKAMTPVSSTWQKSDRFGECLITGLKNSGRKIHGSGSMELDLTQTSYSTIPSIDIECGDAASDHSDAALRSIASGIVSGVDLYFGDSIIKDSSPDGMVSVFIGKTKVTVDGKAYTIDAAPYIQPSSNSTLVPLRFVALAVCGGDLENTDTSDLIKWDPKAETAYVTTPEGEIAFTSGSNKMLVNGTYVSMPNGAKAEIKNGRLYIPFRALGEALNTEVEWEKSTEKASFKIK